MEDYGFQLNDQNEYNGEVNGYTVKIKYHAILEGNRPGISVEILFNPKKGEDIFLSRKELDQYQKQFKCAHCSQLFLTRSTVLMEYRKKAKNFNLNFLFEDIQQATDQLKRLNLPPVSEEKSEQLYEEFKNRVSKN